MVSKLKKSFKRKAREFVSYYYWGRMNGLSSLFTYNDFVKLNHLARRQSSSIRFLGKNVLFPDGFWFLHSIQEIYLDNIYKFASGSSAPYIIDCGANIGLSVIYFKRLYPNCTVVAFEPDRVIFDMLEKNVKQFDLENVSLFNKAVWAEETHLAFFHEGALGGKIVSNDGNQESSDVITIQTSRLNTFLSEKVDFLKIDIEGAEYEVLVDCAGNLKNVNALFVEYHSKSGEQQRLNEILEIISNAGFRYYIKQAWDKVRHPFIDKKGKSFDLQLNIFCYRT